MEWLLLLPALLLAVWLGGLWIGRGDDLSVYDREPDPAWTDTFSSPDGPSAEHQLKVEEIGAMRDQVRGMSLRQRLQFTRKYMEDMPAGKTFDGEFRPAEVAGRPAEWALAPGVDQRRRVLYLHGGAFMAGSPQSHRSATHRFSEAANAAVLAFDYRLLPENRRKDGIEDCRAAYRWILENGPEGRSAPARLFLGGDSAGGNLSLVTASWARDEGLRPADAVVALSPLTDSMYSGASIRDNMRSDRMLGPLFGGLLKYPRWLLYWLYLLENRMTPGNPLVSPVRKNLANLPPTLVQVSEAEMLLDDARRYVTRAREEGSAARLQSWAGLLHVWQLFYPELPEARDAWRRIDAFIRQAEGSPD